MMPAAESSTPLGRYRLIALLGQGGMADVYLAATQGPRGFQKLLVVKLARFTGEPVFATMFLEEARIAAQLEHPNVIQTYEIAEEGTRHYIVMEYLDGGNLARLRQRCMTPGGIPLRTSMTILAQVLEGLDYAHEAKTLDGRDLKVVHRDLSPSNIMVTARSCTDLRSQLARRARRRSSSPDLAPTRRTHRLGNSGDRQNARSRHRPSTAWCWSRPRASSPRGHRRGSGRAR